ncbi:MAG: hypothetical protein H6625_12385 [Bdellovibrionaceae bacterium]|nr:hypothetical protein [Pseudobdellovibrionaceae bacterium]
MITMGTIQITGIRDVYSYSQILRSTDQLNEFPSGKRFEVKNIAKHLKHLTYRVAPRVYSSL